MFQAPPRHEFLLSRGWPTGIMEGKHVRWLSRGQKRIVIFAAVGATCFCLQIALLTVAVHLGADRPIANAIGFAFSAQLNFLLSSRVTWRDRPVSGRRDMGSRWLAYNGTALISLGVNTTVFTLSYHEIGTTPAAALGVLIGTVVVYLTCNLLIFRGTRQVPEMAAQTVMSADPDHVVAR
jgi:putative flippase GtrA